MSALQVVELAVALALLVGGVLLYRRGSSQSAVILLAVAALVAIHGLGWLNYRPSESGL